MPKEKNLKTTLEELEAVSVEHMNVEEKLVNPVNNISTGLDQAIESRMNEIERINKEMKKVTEERVPRFVSPRAIQASF